MLGPNNWPFNGTLLSYLNKIIHLVHYTVKKKNNNKLRYFNSLQ